MKDLKSIGKGPQHGKGFAKGFALEIDEEAMNAAFEAYNKRLPGPRVTNRSGACCCKP
ncbi:hypothetical protein [Streptomyces sp. NPDC058572]|uniref:hypothetical protein n=1 Tax=Streptomyces sp. NPDC058572 TaxID=3346546 RepID=UPI0036607042